MVVAPGAKEKAKTNKGQYGSTHSVVIPGYILCFTARGGDVRSPPGVIDYGRMSMLFFLRYTTTRRYHGLDDHYRTNGHSVAGD